MRRSAVLLLLIPLIGCNPHVSRGQLVGVWPLASSTRENLPFLRNSTARLTLAADGTFTAQNFPELGLPSHGVDSGSGTWGFGLNDGEQVVELVFRTGTLAQMPYGAELDIGSAHELSYFIGDPDEGNRVVFEKLP